MARSPYRCRLRHRATPPACLVRATTTVIFNLGMGVESSAILMRWLTEPETMSFPLRKLIVLSAQVGAEGRRTKALMEQIIFPLLAQHRIRTVQVARAGPSDKDGIAVLSDTRTPSVCHTEGVYTLQDELLAAGTVPQYAAGCRRCSLKFKGSVLDRWLADHLGKKKFIQVMGFNANEQERIARDHSFATVKRATSYPLNEWQWSREQCEAYLLEKTREQWVKSCCGFCPFTGGREHLIERFRDNPAEAASALLIEYVSMALNPRMSLFPRGRSLRASVDAAGLTEAIARFQDLMRSHVWALCEVKRVFYAPAVADRKITALARGSMSEMRHAIREHAEKHGAHVEDGDGFSRAIIRAKEGDTYPLVEHMLVIAPATVADKSRKRFESAWDAATGYQQVAMEFL